MKPGSQKLPGPAGALSGLVLAIVLQGTAHAAEAPEPGVDLGITLGSIWSDNIGLTPGGGASGGIGLLGVTLVRKDDTLRLHSDFDVNLGYQRYLDKEFQSDVIGGAEGTVVLDIAPGVFDWFVKDNFAKLRVNALAADTPTNWESANYFSTGPQLAIRLASNYALNVTGRFSIDSYESSKADSKRVGGTAGLLHELNDRNSVSVILDTERRKFDDDPAGITYNPDYTTRDAYVSYVLDDERTRIQADLGYAQIDLGPGNADSVLARVSLVRQLTPSSSLQLGVDHQYSDSGNSLRAGQDVDGVALRGDSTLIASNPLVTNTFRLGWQFSRRRTEVGLNVSYADESYHRENSQNRYITRYSLSANRKIRPTMRLGVEVHGTIERFPLLDATSNETGASATLDWSAGRMFGWELEYEFRSRGGHGPVERYTENRVSLFLVWSPLGGR